MNYFEEENNETRRLFDLESLIAFQMEHEVQIIRGEDYQYMCYIDKEVYGSSLTPLNALVVGVRKFELFK